jgi:hypothetical protein
MAVGRHVAAAIVGLVLVVFGEVVGVIALLLASKGAGDTYGGDLTLTWSPHYGIAVEYGVVSVAR